MSTARSQTSLASKPVALIDATDLFPQDQRDFMVQVAFDGLYRIVWSETILQEAACAIHRRLRERDGVSQRPKTERMLDLLTKALTSVGAGAGANEKAIHTRIKGLGEDRAAWGTTDPDDRHVIAAALVSEADSLVTSDGRFDVAFCRQNFELRVLGADDFLTGVLAEADDDHIRAPLDALAARWKHPAPFNRAQVIGRLETPLPKAMGTSSLSVAFAGRTRQRHRPRHRLADSKAWPHLCPQPTQTTPAQPLQALRSPRFLTVLRCLGVVLEECLDRGATIWWAARVLGGAVPEIKDMINVAIDRGRQRRSQHGKQSRTRYESHVGWPACRQRPALVRARARPS
jgi:predicted nucleic acid-binding protein